MTTFRRDQSVINRKIPGTYIFPGLHADFTVLGVRGLGLENDHRRVNDAIETVAPDVVMVQICPTRLALASFRAFGRVSGRSWVSGVLLRWMWWRLAERAGSLAGNPEICPLYIGSELAEAVMTAAERNVRVVMGDRDLLRTISRAWEALTVFHRIAILAEFIICTALPTAVARWLFFNDQSAMHAPACSSNSASKPQERAGGGAADGGDHSSGEDNELDRVETASGEAGGIQGGEQVCAGCNDSFSALLAHFGQRWPRALGEQLVEDQTVYALDSLDRLDEPLSTLCPNLGAAADNSAGGGGGAVAQDAGGERVDMRRRPRVLAILGERAARIVAQERAGGHSSSSSSSSSSSRTGSRGGSPSRCRSPSAASAASLASVSQGSSDWGGAGLQPMSVLSSKDRRRLSRASHPALRSPALLLPLAIVLVLLGVPLLYVAFKFHSIFIGGLLEELYS